MGIHPKKQRPVDSMLLAITTNRLRDRDDVRFVKGARERRASMPRGAERNALRSDRSVGALQIVGSDQARHIDQHRGWRGFSSERTYFHDGDSTRRPSILLIRIALLLKQNLERGSY